MSDSIRADLDLHLRTIPPHVAARLSAKLMRRAATEIRALDDEVIKLQKRAARWDFIESELARAGDPRMDGTFLWRVASPRGRARTFAEAIDNMITGE